MRRLRFARAGAVVLAVTLALSACAAPSGSGAPAAPATADAVEDLKPFTFTFGVVPGSITYLPMYVAKDKGFLEEEGLDVEIFSAASGDSEILAGLTSNSVHATNHNFLYMARADNSGTPMDMVGPYFYVNRYIVTRADSDIPVAGKGGVTWEDTFRALKDKTVGVIAGAWTTDLDGLLTKAGVDPTSVTKVNLSFGTPQLAGLEQKQVDAVFTVPAVALGAEKSGDYKIATNMIESGPSFYKGAMATGIGFTEAFFDQDPTLRDRMRRAMVATVEFCNDPANLDEIAQIALDNGLNTDFAAVRAQIAILAPGYGTEVQRADVEASLDWGRSQGQLDSSSTVSAEDLVVEGLLEK
jgi:NitT/TauT family transport system substrate-binding protein